MYTLGNFVNEKPHACVIKETSEIVEVRLSANIKSSVAIVIM